MSVHPYTVDEQAAGFALAELLIARIESGEPIECDALAQQAGIARFGSIERQRAFLARVQQELVRGARDA